MNSHLRAEINAHLERIAWLIETGRHELAHGCTRIALATLNTCPHGHTNELGTNGRCNACRRQRRQAGHNA